MRAGWVISVTGHAGLVLMTLHLWSTAEPPAFLPPSVQVPIEVTAVAPETNLRALAIPTEQEDAVTQDDASEDIVATEPEPSPEPAPRQQQREEARRGFNLDDVLVDRDRPDGPQRRDGAPAERNQQAAGLSDAEVTSLTNRLQSVADAHIARRNCWQGVDDLVEPETLVVVVGMRFNRDGALEGQPRVISPRNTTFSPQARVAVDRAMRAVRTCSPFPFPEDPVLGEHYEIWRDVEYRFGQK